jgi:hypothetical protein
MRNLVCSLSIAALLALATPAFAQDAMKQMQLTEQQVKNYIAAQKDMSALSEKMEGNSKPDPKVQQQMEAAIKKAGFKDFNEYGAVGDNIQLVMSGIDPDTKNFSEPKAAIQKEINEVKSDKSMSADEKKQALAELNEALKTAEPVKFPGNVTLVKEYYDQLDKGE